MASSEGRCSHRERLTLCLTRLRVWQKSRGRGGKSPALLVSSILNATRSKRVPAADFAVWSLCVRFRKGFGGVESCLKGSRSHAACCQLLT
jgi:hypothetical protein